MTENAVHFLAKNELGHFITAKFWPGPSLDWRSPHWHLMGFLCYSSLGSHSHKNPPAHNVFQLFLKENWQKMLIIFKPIFEITMG